jgi:1-deoxy-D-xylulose-5-phosphate reductoisomerase
VQAFLEERIGFDEIAEVVEAALAAVDGSPVRDVDDLVAADAEARAIAEGALVRA